MTERRYHAQLFGWLIVYGALLVGSLTALHRGAVPKALVIPVSLLPMLPAFGILLLVMHRHRSLDEFEQRIQAEGIMFAFGATAILTFSYGFLENTAGAPELSYLWVWAVMGTTWLVGVWLAYYRYR